MNQGRLSPTVGGASSDLLRASRKRLKFQNELIPRGRLLSGFSFRPPPIKYNRYGTSSQDEMIRTAMAVFGYAAQIRFEYCYQSSSRIDLAVFTRKRGTLKRPVRSHFTLPKVSWRICYGCRDNERYCPTESGSPQGRRTLRRLRIREKSNQEKDHCAGDMSRTDCAHANRGRYFLPGLQEEDRRQSVARA